MADWRLPYRSMDASGSPDSAGAVGEAWIDEIAAAESPGRLSIETPPLGRDGGATVLYRDQEPIAAAFIYRDPMNFAVLIRWRPPLPDRPAEH